MWSGSTGNIPTGWTLCDGTDGAPDLRDRFIAGAGGQYNTNDTGGEDTVTLTEGEMPSHNHGGSTGAGGEHSHTVTVKAQNMSGDDSPDGTVVGGRPEANITGTFDYAAADHSHNIQLAGSDQAHENRPQFYALAFIYKL